MSANDTQHFRMDVTKIANNFSFNWPIASSKNDIERVLHIFEYNVNTVAARFFDIQLQK